MFPSDFSKLPGLLNGWTSGDTQIQSTVACTMFTPGVMQNTSLHSAIVQQVFYQTSSLYLKHVQKEMLVQLTFGTIIPTKVGATIPVIEPTLLDNADNEPA